MTCGPITQATNYLCLPRKHGTFSEFLFFADSALVTQSRLSQLNLVEMFIEPHRHLGVSLFRGTFWGGLPFKFPLKTPKQGYRQKRRTHPYGFDIAVELDICTEGRLVPGCQMLLRHPENIHSTRTAYQDAECESVLSAKTCASGATSDCESYCLRSSKRIQTCSNYGLPRFTSTASCHQATPCSELATRWIECGVNHAETQSQRSIAWRNIVCSRALPIVETH